MVVVQYHAILRGPSLKISQVRDGMDGIDVIGRITLIGSSKTVETNVGATQVTAAVVEDDTGKIHLNLWRNQIDIVEDGDFVRIENGFVRTFEGQLELNVGGRGRIIVISRDL